MNKKIPILSISFRPFFILAAIIAVINPTLWVFNYLGDIEIPLNIDSPLFWHGHEMIFGFTGAIIAGFILTASANWTGTKAYSGKPLLFLILLWAIERSSYFLPLNVPLQLLLMNLFFPTLTIMLLVKLMKFSKQKYVFIPILLSITIGNFLHSWGYLYSNELLEISGRQISTSLIRFIILLIAGRVIPFFTRKKIEGLQISLPNWMNPLCLIPIALLIIPWPEETPKLILAMIYLFAIVGNLLRQVMWKPFKTTKVPILFILHIGVSFITLGLFLEMIGLYNDQVNVAQATLHLLMAGGLGVVGIGIMTRVSLGHTGRIIVADKWTKLAYFCVISGSLARALIPIIFPDYYFDGLYLFSALWTSGFLIFLVKFTKILTSPRLDQTK